MKCSHNRQVRAWARWLCHLMVMQLGALIAMPPGLPSWGIPLILDKAATIDSVKPETHNKISLSWNSRVQLLRERWPWGIPSQRHDSASAHWLWHVRKPCERAKTSGAKEVISRTKPGVWTGWSFAGSGLILVAGAFWEVKQRTSYWPHPQGEMNGSLSGLAYVSLRCLL